MSFAQQFCSIFVHLAVKNIQKLMKLLGTLNSEKNNNQGMKM